MAEKPRMTRRKFLAVTGLASVAAGAGVVPGRAGAVPKAGTPADAPSSPPGSAPSAKPAPSVPTQAWGRAGQRLSRIGMGIDIDLGDSLLLLNLALRWGVTYWDTASAYAGGEAERGIGRYFRRFPDDRAKVFLSTKSMRRDFRGLTADLDQSLERLRTDHVDAFQLHAIETPAELSDAATAEIRRFAEVERKRGRIRFLGFSTHSHMADLLALAATMPWIDLVEVKYNYRLMGDPAMQRGLEATGRAGKGVVVMKVLADGPVRRDSDEDMRLAGHFLQRGFTPEQAALKAALECPWVTCASLAITTMDRLSTMVGAATDRAGLTQADLRRLQDHADATRGTFCAGCASRCGDAAGGLPIADVMRFLTYAGRPGGAARARQEFARLPAAVRDGLATTDLAPCEARCPNGLPIARLVRDALDRLA